MKKIVLSYLVFSLLATAVVPINPAAINHAPLSPVQTTATINYVYDPLYRLKEANYSDGKFYHYTYDSVGNRLTQQSHLSNDTYTYDNANRLTNLNAIPYSWDANGNLLNDGANMYAYDSANRLKSINGGSTATFSYNGLGDRLSQNGVNYTLDLNAGLTQILADGTNTYLYGLGRIAERQGTASEYYLGDVLGSVRQLTNNGGTVTLARSYDPFGKTMQSIGTAQTDYGFTGEFTDASGLVYLRARYYESLTGRFTSRDSFEGNVNTPASLNRFNYGHSNPVMNTDPSGQCIIPMLCTVLAGGAVGAGFGAGIGALLAGATYEMARQGLCGCEGEQIISKYSRSEFIWLGTINGAKFGLIFGLIAGTGNAGMAVASLAGLGVSVHSAMNALQRLVADPNNRCALFDLTVAVFFGVITRNLAIKATDAGLATGQWFVPIKPSAPVAVSTTTRVVELPGPSGGKEAFLTMWRGNPRYPFTANELFRLGRQVYGADKWLSSGLSTKNGIPLDTFPQAFKEAMTNASRINFDITNLNPQKAWTEGNIPIDQLRLGNITSYEYYQIKTHPEWLAKTTFFEWENGVLKWFTTSEKGEIVPQNAPPSVFH